MIAGAARAERAKLLARPLTRGLLALCALAPALFAGFLRLQGGSPSDALLGAWVHTSGFAVSLVVLSFAGSWGLPLLAGLAAGDTFSSEDRYGTWPMILCRSTSRGEIFVAKVLTAAALLVALQLTLALVSIAAGVAFVGASPIPSLDGQMLSSAHALTLVLASWLACLLPTLAFMSVGILVSVATRSGIAGVLAPGLTALLMQLLLLVGRGSWVHAALITNGYNAWHGLLGAAGASDLPKLALVSLAWIVGCLTAAWAILRTRDMAPATRRRPLALSAGAAAVLSALLAAGANLGPTRVHAARLQRNVTQVFLALTALQQHELGRPTGRGFAVEPLCDHNADSTSGGLSGPGSWGCILTLALPTFPGDNRRFVPTILSYDLSVQQDGCWKAQTPSGLAGGPTMTDAAGRTILNPLYVMYGCA